MDASLREKAFRDLVVGRALRELPEHMLWVPARPGTHPPCAGKLFPLRAEQVDKEIRDRALMHGITVLPDFDLLEFPKACRRCEAIQLSWAELARDLLECSLEHGHETLQRIGNGQRLSSTRLFRWIWERIAAGDGTACAQPKNPPEFHGRFISTRRQFSERLGDYSPDGFGALSGGRPLLLMGLRRAAIAVSRLKKSHRRLFSPAGEKITKDEVKEECHSLANPYHRLVLDVCDAMRPILESMEAQDSETDLDRLFFERLRQVRQLQGIGTFRDYTLSHVWSPGGWLLRVGLFMGRRPFLQQVAVHPEPIFILYDLKKHPITVFFELPVGADFELRELPAVSIYAISPHASICSHAFVYRTQAYPHIGRICLENTRARLLSLHRKDGVFDPVYFLIEELRSAVRILRYGVRERDGEITQHNRFSLKLNRDYQAVIGGWARASEVALELGAEIVRYDR